MIKDIDQPEVDGVSVAITEEVNEEGEKQWTAYLINLKEDTLENVLIRSNGYGIKDGEESKTSELRRFIERIDPLTTTVIEPLLGEALELNNQYWISYYVDKVLYDKKYVFEPGSVSEANFISIPFIDKQGVVKE
ncbi:MAG: hypothetical protein P8H59_00665 [Flavobacteriales bacterium]|nr:hypothetical protein [Flavobacteriales bacterium]MDG2245021.1 hypothetical protein [Flavobacteriales bacterium]